MLPDLFIFPSPPIPCKASQRLADNCLAKPPAREDFRSSLGEGWCFVIRLSSIVVSELPKTATGKIQKYVLLGKPAISKQ